MAILTGGQVIAEELGLQARERATQPLGKCRRVIIDKDNTTLVGGAGKKAEIQGRIEPDSHADRATPLPTTIAKSSRSGWPS